MIHFEIENITNLTYLFILKVYVLSLMFIIATKENHEVYDNRSCFLDGAPTPNNVRSDWDFISGRAPELLGASNIVNKAIN